MAAISLLPHVDRIIVMKDGKISESGSYQELMEQKGAFADFLLEYLEEEMEDEDGDSKSCKKVRSLSIVDGKKPKTPTSGGRLVQAEKEETGGVRFKVYKGYFVAMGLWSAFAVFLFMTLSSAVNIYSSLWLSYWGDDALVPERVKFLYQSIWS